MWKTHPTSTDYEAHEDGRVRNRVTHRMLSGYVTPKGYRRISVDGRSVFKHRFVLETFVPCPDPTMHATHANHDKEDNRLANLRWLTHGQNLRENVGRGQNQPALTSEQAREFWRLRDAGWMPKALGAHFGRDRYWAKQIILRSFYSDCR